MRYEYKTEKFYTCEPYKLDDFYVYFNNSNYYYIYIISYFKNMYSDFYY